MLSILCGSVSPDARRSAPWATFCPATTITAVLSSLRCTRIGSAEGRGVILVIRLPARAVRSFCTALKPPATPTAAWLPGGHAASGRSRPAPHLTATTARCPSHRRFRLQRGKAAFATFPNLRVQWTQDAPVPSSLFGSTRPQDRAALTKQASRERWTGHAGQDYRRLGRGRGVGAATFRTAPRPQAPRRYRASTRTWSMTN
jgi:hypothetical protein